MYFEKGGDIIMKKKVIEILKSGRYVSYDEQAEDILKLLKT